MGGSRTACDRWRPGNGPLTRPRQRGLEPVRAAGREGWLFRQVGLATSGGIRGQGGRPDVAILWPGNQPETWHNRSVDTGPTVGWNPIPEKPNHFRYWDGRDWTAVAMRSEQGVTARVSLSGRRRLWHGVYRNSLVFHIAAWLNCSVPGVRGRLDRFRLPREIRTLRAIDET